MSNAGVVAELAAWGIDIATIKELAIDDDSAVIHYSKDGKPWGLVIEQDRAGVERIRKYLKAQGVPIVRDVALG